MLFVTTDMVELKAKLGVLTQQVACSYFKVNTLGIIASEIVAGGQRATLSLVWSIIVRFQVRNGSYHTTVNCSNVVILFTLRW